MTEQENGTSLTRSDRTELDGLRRLGELQKARLQHMQELAGTIAGLEFGSVKGAALSKGTRFAAAEFCHATGANPALHLDILGGRLYPNGQFWADVLNTNPHFIEYRQHSISETAEDALLQKADRLRKMAGKAEADAERLGSEELRQKAGLLTRDAIELEEEAADLPVQRAQFHVPDWAEAVVVTEIDRFIESAPLDAIKAGEVQPDPWIKTVVECNWAGGKGDEKKKNHADEKAFSWDPIGDANPGKSAGTRSLRRCAAKAFATWMDKFSAQMERAQEALEADWEILAEEVEERAALASGPQAVTVSGGEPSAAPSGGAMDPIEAQRRAYFANLRDAGVTEGKDRDADQEARYAWQERQGLPESTRDWTLSEWREANDILTAQARLTYVKACNALGIESGPFAEGHLGRPAMMIRDYEQLTEKLEETPVPDGEETPQGQGALL